MEKSHLQNSLPLGRTYSTPFAHWRPHNGNASEIPPDRCTKRIRKTWVPFLTVILSLAAWTSACSAAPSPTPPSPDRTGIASVDRVIDVVESGDVEAQRSLLHFAAFPCTTTEGFGGPPKCLPGEPEGTPVEALPILGAEGGHMRKSEIDTWTGVGAARLYAVYTVPATTYADAYYPVGEYSIAFFMPDWDSTVVFQVGSQGIVRVDYRFESPSEEILGLHPENLILGPFDPAD